MAYGDALGVGAEFMNRQELSSYYPEGLREFSQIIRDPHRSQWKRGEWTNDTELATMMLESVLESDGFVPRAQCLKFQEWFAEEERDIPPFLRLYCTNREWPDNPVAVAHKLWYSSGMAEASNETLHRGIVTGMTSLESELNEDTRRSVLMTHDDGRCVATTMVMARVVRDELKQRRPDIDSLVSLCNAIDPRVVPYLKSAWEGDIESLGIDDNDTQTWTRKGMAAALWGLWHHNTAADTIHKVIDLGGDANTNACMAGALAGIRYGYDEVPAEKEKIIRFDYLIDLGERLADYVDHKSVWQQ